MAARTHGHYAGTEKEPPAKHDKTHPPFHSHSARPKRHPGKRGGRKRSM
jgi:hypothetical protein